VVRFLVGWLGSGFWFGFDLIWVGYILNFSPEDQEAVWSLKVLVYSQKSTWCSNPEDIMTCLQDGAKKNAQRTQHL
jgi:hypothetical protein